MWVHPCLLVICPEAFLEANLPDVHPLFNPERVPLGGISLFKPDWMHTKSLGTDSALLGSCIMYLISVVLPGTAEQNLGLIWESVQNFYRANHTPVRLGRLTMKMVQNEPFPKLSCKAMETRHLIPALEHFVRAWVGDPLVARFQMLLKLSRGLDDVVFSNKTMALSLQERHALKEGIFKYNQVLTDLARYFHQRGLPYCNYTVKNHYLCHLGLEAAKSGLSPRVAFCYEGEDFMSLIKKLCMSSSRGVESAKLMEKVLPKYLRGLDILLKHC